MEEKVIVKKDKCIGCGRCTEICPNGFVLNEEGKADFVVEITPENIACAKKAADECPQEAIEVEVKFD